MANGTSLQYRAVTCSGAHRTKVACIFKRAPTDVDGVDRERNVAREGAAFVVAAFLMALIDLAGVDTFNERLSTAGTVRTCVASVVLMFQPLFLLANKR